MKYWCLRRDEQAAELATAVNLVLFSKIERKNMRDFLTDIFLLLYRQHNHLSDPRIITRL
jgi:hypothetical protein